MRTTSTYNMDNIVGGLESTDHAILEQKLQRVPFSLMSKADDNGFTLLHHAVLAGVKGKVGSMIMLAKANGANNDHIKEWVNSRTSADAFTPLHLASFKGNMDAVRVLIDHGSDIFALNEFGLNMLHVAAQGDVAAPLYFFWEKGVDLNK